MRAILTYHSVDDSGSPISIAPGEFARHVRFLAGGRVKVLGLADLLQHGTDEDALAITFDDGFRNFAELAWPLLREHGLPATLFVVTDRAGGTNDWDAAPGLAIPRLPLLAWEELARLAGEGLHLGAHGRTHASLRGIPRDRVVEEVRGSRDRLAAETGGDPSAFAYPFGDLDPASAAVVRETFARACTTEWRAVSRGDEPHLLPRLDAFYFRSNDQLEGFGSDGFRRWLALRGAVRRAGAIARRLAPDALLGGGLGKATPRRTMGREDAREDRG